MNSKLVYLASLLTDEDFLKKFSKDYHYLEEDYESLSLVADKMAPLIREGLCCKYRLFDVEGGRAVKVGITLGEGVDALQDTYLEEGFLAEGYMVEALAGELLGEAYSAFEGILSEETGYHIAAYHFLGSEEGYPIEDLPAMLAELEAPMRCNEAYFMLPKKSVTFVASLTTEDTAGCVSICANCASKNCPHRKVEKQGEEDAYLKNIKNVPLHYGIARIFGRKI